MSDFNFVSATQTAVSSSKRGGNGGGRGVQFPDKVRMGAMKPSKTHGQPMFRIAIGENLVRDERFKVGDKVDWLYDVENNVGMIKRDNNGRYTLHHNTKNSTALRITGNLYEGMPLYEDALTKTISAADRDWETMYIDHYCRV